MNHRLDIYRSRWMAATLLGIVVGSQAHATADDDSMMSQLKVGEPKPRSDFYVKVDTGAVFVQPPKKDNNNFQDSISSGPATGVNTLTQQSADQATWTVGGTVGFYLPGQPTEPWMGKNLRVEASGSYFATDDGQNSGLSVSPGGTFARVDRLDGNYAGPRQPTDIGSLSVSSNPVASETLTTKDTFYQAGTAFRNDYLFDYGRVVLSPRLGFEWSHLTQNFHTTASGARGSVDQQEEIDTDYFGPKISLELKIQLARNFIYFADGEMSPYYASSDYSGSQNGSSVPGIFLGGSGHNVATDSQSKISFKGGLTSGFYYDFGPVIVKVDGGFEYWNYVASVQESSAPGGADPFNGVVKPFTVQPSHLISSDMFNPTAGVSVILPF